ncbi:hypothetical protein C5745_14135 [Sphingobacterium haloxyli]|uniref:Uncharacterized protein n=1 Tax=Sphingobacterium haloxyli TaxID=2100533 RepID=A0A2S9J1V9_9SPHI|nr:hypothetical protein C5745_14135 [Sphingobacterium haloxyli]
MNSSKNHTISKIIAKAILRITVILIAFPIIVYFTNPEIMSQQIFFPHRWAVLFPILLVLVFIALLIPVLKDRYTKIEYNWLFSLTGIFVCLYLVLFYTRILSIL